MWLIPIALEIFEEVVEIGDKLILREEINSECMYLVLNNFVQHLVRKCDLRK